MKNYIYKIAAFAAIIVFAVACEDAKYSTIQNRLYLNEAAPDSGTPQQVESIVIEGTTSTAIHARIAQPLNYDVTVQIGVASEFVDEYNAMYGTEYEILPEQYFTYDKEAVISAGNVLSEDITITIEEYELDVTCCIPLKITSSDSNVQISEATSRIMYVLSVPLVQIVPTLTYRQAPTTGDAVWGISTNAWTVEGWLNMSAFSINNQAIWSFDCSKGTEIYIRFGDADVAYNKLQIKTYGTQFNSNAEFATNTWYHVAFTCGDGKVTMYINGEEDSSMEISMEDSDSYVINGCTLCGSGSTYFKANAMLGQFRFWSTALSQSLIQKQMNGAVSPSAAGLEAYWKMDEGEGSVFYDSTSYGRDLTCSQAPTWSTTVNFSHPND